jgi:ABC-2 type transport system permease protein
VSRVAALVARELRSLVYAPIAWIVWTLFLFVAGWFFFSSVYQFSSIVATYAGMGQDGMLERLNLNEFVIAGLFQNLLVLFLFLVPALTMRGFADERRAGTDELLLTAPVTPGQIVAGKYLGLLAVALVLVLGAGFYVALLARYGDPETGPILTGLAGLTLALAALVALGVAV